MELSFLTWNIWFSDYQLIARTIKIMDICHELQPDFIAFQEVTNDSLKVIEAKKGNYKLCEEGRLKQRYDTIILSKHNCVYRERIPLPGSEMGRNFLRCYYNVGLQEVNIGTFHLESVFKPSQLRMKNDQLKFIYDNSPEKCIVMGDTNFSKNEEVPWGLVDVFEHIGSPAAYRWTYCGKKNPFVNGRLNSRLDRIYTKNLTFNVKNFHLVGVDDILHFEEDSIHGPPSDHYGVYCKMKMDELVM